jgi:hypothetical protein
MNIQTFNQWISVFEQETDNNKFLEENVLGYLKCYYEQQNIDDFMKRQWDAYFDLDYTEGGITGIVEHYLYDRLYKKAKAGKLKDDTLEKAVYDLCIKYNFYDNSELSTDFESDFENLFLPRYDASIKRLKYPKFFKDDYVSYIIDAASNQCWGYEDALYDFDNNKSYLNIEYQSDLYEVFVYLMTAGFLNEDGTLKNKGRFDITESDYRDKSFIDKFKTFINNKNLIKKFLNSDLTVKEFMEKYAAAIKTGKYGI